ncbi:MAG: type IVB secretion system protein IcmH/DotU [Pseudomonadaceae bacterium]
MYTAHYPSDDRTVILAGDTAWNPGADLTDAIERQPPPVDRVSDTSRFLATAQPNPLLTAAAPLLSELLQLKNGQLEPEPAEVLRVTLHTGMQQFDQDCQTLAVTPANRQAARYILCTALDEAILTTRWGNDSNWSKHSLLSAFHQDTFGGERFFLLLTRLSQDMAQHLELLELMLVCLTLGYEGRYRLQANGHAELERIRKRLHDALQHHRGQPDMALVTGCPQDSACTLPRRTPRRWVAFAAAGCMAALFFAFNHHIEQHRESALKPYLDSSVANATRPGADQ